MWVDDSFCCDKLEPSAMLYEALLVQGLEQMNIELSAQQVAQLLVYHQLLIKWNRAYNLTAVRDPKEMISRHLLDALSILRYVREFHSILDLGSGAGLPGIPLAIALTDRPFVLLDANGKKTRFLVQVVANLQLSHVAVVHERMEIYCPTLPFAAICSRAFAALGQMVLGARHLLADGGVFLAMKAVVSDEELAALPSDVNSVDVKALTVPGDSKIRHLVQLRL